MQRQNIIGEQVKGLRVQRQWTQQTLATKLQNAGLDISRSSLAKVEARLIKVTDRELFYFARVFNVSLCQLFPPIHPGDPDLNEKLSLLMSNPD